MRQLLFLILVPAIAAACAIRQDATEGQESAIESEEATVAALTKALKRCVAREVPLPPMTEKQTKLAADFYDGVQQAGPCTGCHFGKKSSSAVARFTLDSAEEFAKGIAFRHRTTREMAEKCIEEGPDKVRLMTTLKSRRYQSTVGIEIAGNGKKFNARGGIEFFTPGTDDEMHEQAVSFLAGGFEVPAQPGDWAHDIFFAWLREGARYESSTHLDTLVDAIVGERLHVVTSNHGAVVVKE